MGPTVIHLADMFDKLAPKRTEALRGLQVPVHVTSFNDEIADGEIDEKFGILDPLESVVAEVIKSNGDAGRIGLKRVYVLGHNSEKDPIVQTRRHIELAGHTENGVVVIHEPSATDPDYLPWRVEFGNFQERCDENDQILGFYYSSMCLTWRADELEKIESILGRINS